MDKITFKLSTFVFTMTAKEGDVIIQTIYYVRSPLMFSTVTLFNGVSKTGSLTFSTVSTSTTNMNGEELTVIIYLVQTELNESGKTIVSAWVHDITSTHSTERPYLQMNRVTKLRSLLILFTFQQLSTLQLYLLVV